MNKQIEEMARTLCGEKEKTCEGCDSFDSCEFWIEASVLYNAGYRKQRDLYWFEEGKPPVLIETSENKQSEGEWIDKPTGAYNRMQSWCSACGKHSGIGGIKSNRHKPFCPNCGKKMKGESNG